LPVAVIAWLGVSTNCQGQNLGRRILASALSDCYEASSTFSFVAVVLDCVDEKAKSFYQKFDFTEVPGHSMKLFLSFKLLEAMMS
jgi:ribosomal protein S18 acetylase RimI-like enzyme